MVNLGNPEIAFRTTLLVLEIKGDWAADAPPDAQP